MKKFIIKDVKDNVYYGGQWYGWRGSAFIAETFESKIEAERFMVNNLYGWLKVEEIYIVENNG